MALKGAGEAPKEGEKKTLSWRARILTRKGWSQLLLAFKLESLVELNIIDRRGKAGENRIECQLEQVNWPPLYSVPFSLAGHLKQKLLASSKGRRLLCQMIEVATVSLDTLF